MAASHKRIVGKYELGKVLAAGYFDCRTRLCTHIVTGAQYVVRIYDKAVLSETQWMWNRIRDAIHVIRTLPKHENIVETAECFETQSSLYILMQLFAPMQLTKLYTSETSTGQRVSIPIEKTKHYYAQVVRGVMHMHSRNVVHLGLAPDHIMVNDRDQVKIGFLVSCMYFTKGKSCREIRGTTHTVAPEILRNEGYDPYLADAWSMGVLLYFMLHRGRYPHDGANTTKNIMYNRVRPPDPSLPPEAKELIMWLMHPIPSRRMRVEQILTHPFFIRDYGDMSSAERNSTSTNGVSLAETDYSVDPATGEHKVTIRIPYGLSRQEEAAYIIQHTYRAYRSRRQQEFQKAESSTQNTLLRHLRNTERLSSVARGSVHSLPPTLQMEDVLFADERGQGGKQRPHHQQRLSRVSQLPAELPCFEETGIDEIAADGGVEVPGSPKALGVSESLILFNNGSDDSIGAANGVRMVERGPRRSSVRFSLPASSSQSDAILGEVVTGVNRRKSGDRKEVESPRWNKKPSVVRSDPHTSPTDISAFAAMEAGGHIKLDATRPCPVCHRLPMLRVGGRKPYSKTSYVYRKGEFTVCDEEDF